MFSRTFAALLFLVAATPFAHAFGSIDLLGQATEHERITRIALAREGLGPETLDEIAGKTNRMGAVGAPDSPERGLMGNAAAHCDGGDFLALPGYPHDQKKAQGALEACRRFILRAMDDAVVKAGRIADESGRVDGDQIPSFVPCLYNGEGGRAKCEVLDLLGLALHAAQDFYSHTNWVDIPDAGPESIDNPPGLRNDGPSPFIDPGRRGAYVPGLISGCFEGKPERAFCEGRVRHRALNKDNGRIDVASGAIGKGESPRGAINGNFERAVKAAIADTRGKWRWFNQAVLAKYGKVRGEAILCGMRSDHERECD